MKALDVALLALVAIVLFFAVRRMIRTRGSGGCGCSDGCVGCASRCDSETEEKPK